MSCCFRNHRSVPSDERPSTTINSTGSSVILLTEATARVKRERRFRVGIITVTRGDFMNARLLTACTAYSEHRVHPVFSSPGTGRVEWRRDRFRPTASCVSALSSIVANGHQVLPTFPLDATRVRHWRRDKCQRDPIIQRPLSLLLRGSDSSVIANDFGVVR